MFNKLPTKTRVSIKFLILIVLVCVVQLISTMRAFAATGINDQISFQGKVVNTNGTNVTNGSYTFVFTIYDAATVGTTLWTESKSVTVTDGIFQTNLGDITDLPGSVNFNTDNIYLGVNFNSDGEMSPRIQFTSVPQAFNAEKVAGLTVTNTTGSLTIPDATAITFSGANNLTLTTSGATNVTLPTTGTLSTLAGVETLNNKTIGTAGLTFAGAATDITSGTDEDITIDANGTGSLIISDATDLNGSLSLGGDLTFDATTPTIIINADETLTITDGTNTLLTLSDSGTAGTLTVTGEGSFGYLNAGPTASVSSTDEGTIYYDSDDDQLKVYANGKWQADRSTATVIVGTSNGAGASKNYEKADYVCGASDCDTTIESAITALPAGGGVVVLLEGTYVIDSNAIDITKDNVTLTGSGKGTILQRGYDTATYDGVITIGDNATAVSGVTISDLAIDGQRSTYSGFENLGVFINGNTGVIVNNILVRDVFIYNTHGDGIYSEFTTRLAVTNSIFNNNGDAIDLYEVYDTTIANNQIYSPSNDGFYISNSSELVISGNTIQSPGYRGIEIFSSVSGVIITGNTFDNITSSYAMSAAFSYSSVSNNLFKSISTSAISTSGSYNSFSNNIISEVGNIAISILGDYNSVTGNNLYDSSGTHTGINMWSGADNNYIANNQISGAGFSVKVADAGAGNTIQQSDRYDLDTALSTGTIMGLDWTGATSLTGSTTGVSLDFTDITGNGQNLTGLNLSNLGSAGAGLEYALQIGSGWDSDIHFADTSAILSITDGGGWTFTDGTNILLRLEDDGTSGNLTVGGEISSGTLIVSGEMTAGSISLTSGNVTLQNGETIDNSTDNTIAFITNDNDGAGVVRLPVKTTTGDPALDVEGNMYYNSFDNKFRCYQGAAWTDCIGSGGGQTPWTSDIDAAGYDVTSVSNVGFQETTGAPAGTTVSIYRDNSGDMNLNVLTGKALNVQVAGTDEYTLTATAFDANDNTIQTTGSVLGNSIDRTTAGALAIGNTNATSVSLCNSAGCDTISIGTNTDADTITIGDSNDGLTIASSTFNVASGAVSGVTTMASSGDWTWSATTPTITLNSGEGLSITDGSGAFNFDTDAGPSYTGAARPTRKVTLSPEFAGATLVADGSSNTGTMISDFCENGFSADVPNTNTGVCNTATDIHNYYQWTTSEGTAQDYDIFVRYRIPDNFSGWATNPVDVYGKRTDVTNNAVTVYVYDSTGTLENSGGTQVAGTTWTSTTVETTFAGTYTAGDYMTIRIVMNADTNDSVQVGEINLDYLSSN